MSTYLIIAPFCFPKCVLFNFLGNLYDLDNDLQLIISLGTCITSTVLSLERCSTKSYQTEL